MRVCIAVLVLTLVVPSLLRAQVSAGALTAALSQIRDHVVAEQTVLREKPPPAIMQKRWERTRQAVDWLINRANRTNLADVTPAYLQALQRVAELTKKASDEQWEDAASELEAKVEHCRRLDIGMGGTILLQINTRRTGGPVGNWQVFYLLKIYEHAAGASPTNFPQLSTPTEAVIEPGRYWIWARDPATGKTSERVLVRVVGQKQLLVDLPVP
jgi:hypothetical protein